MGWFTKEKKEMKVPSLPELPKLPELPSINPRASIEKPIHQLPSYPQSSFGEKFSQNAIRDAVSGDNKNIKEENISEKKIEIPKLNERSFTEKISKHTSIQQSTQKIEPVFIQIDKFEESLKIFEDAKKKIHDMENMLKDIQKIKQEEENELEFWENELTDIKNQIKKVDKTIFSKIE